MRLRRKNEQGDTLVEVMFAFAVFAMVVVSCLTIMNQGIATAQRSLEVTLVRQQIDSQAETLRYLHQAYVAQHKPGSVPAEGAAAQWKNLSNNYAASSTASEFGDLPGGACPGEAPGDKPFILDPISVEVSNGIEMVASDASGLPPFAQVARVNDAAIAKGYGMWVEAVRKETEADRPRYIDFHIRACWDGPGQNAPMTLGTIVRLYEPR